MQKLNTRNFSFRRFFKDGTWGKGGDSVRRGFQFGRHWGNGLALAVWAVWWGSLGMQAGEATASPPKTGAPPALNQPFEKPDLDVPQWVKQFEREGREVYDQRERIVRVTGVRPGMVVADVGAGTGLFEPLFARAVGPKGRVLAEDISPKFLDYIRHRASAAGLKNVETVLGTDRSANLPTNAVDLVFICDTYHHFEYPQAMLASIHQALKPGGWLVLVEFRRIPGQSAPWLLRHVRAGREVFTREIVQAGFREVDSFDFLKQNYIIRFRKVAKQ